jgi:type IV pilus assembly protein PilA
MKRFMKNDGFTLIELLVVILIIGILIAVSAPSFLGQTQKAHDSAGKQNNAVAYRAAKAYAVDNPAGQNSFSGFDNSALFASEPELNGKTVVTSAAGTSLVVTSVESGRTCVLTADADTGIASNVCS